MPKDRYIFVFTFLRGWKIFLSLSRWVGFIKDYDGGTLMECYVHPAMDYLHVPQVVAKQRAFIFERLKQSSQWVFQSLCSAERLTSIFFQGQHSIPRPGVV
jgi:hypothetical protein